MDWKEQYDMLMQQAAGLKRGPAQAAIYEQAIKLADLHEQRPYAFRARMRLVRAGKGHQAIAAYSWCLACCDRDPETFDERDILWEYKWVVNHSIGFPDISLRQLMAMFDDMAVRYQRNGAGLRPVYNYKASFAIRMGRFEEAKTYIQAYKSLPGDEFDDCEACEQADEVIEAVYVLGDDRLALQKAEPILSGALRCGGKPYTTYGTLLDSLVRLGKIDQAEDYFNKGYGPLSEDEVYICDIADYFRYALISGKSAKSRAIFEKHLSWALNTYELEDRFQMLLPCLYFLKRLVSEDCQILLRLPRQLAHFNHQGRSNVKGLHAWMFAEAQDIAQRFDRRNENSYFQDQMDAREYEKLAALFAAASARGNGH